MVRNYFDVDDTNCKTNNELREGGGQKGRRDMIAGKIMQI